MSFSDTTVAGLIKELTDKTRFRDLINLQQELILGIESDKVLPQIEDLISNKFNLITVNILMPTNVEICITDICCRCCD